MKWQLAGSLIFFGLIFLTSGKPVQGDAEPLLADGAVAIRSALGMTDEAAMRGLARGVDARALIAAFYSQQKSVRLSAILLTGERDDPVFALLPLAALLGSNDRQTARTALFALERVTNRLFSPDYGEPLPVRLARQMVAALNKVAAPRSYSPDVRSGAILLAARWQTLVGKPYLPPLEELAKEDPQVLQAALGVVKLPFGPKALELVVALAVQDDFLPVAGTALALLCENALANGVATPSADWQERFLSLLAAGRIPEVVGPTLGCLAKFPYDQRAELTDNVLANKTDWVARRWHRLTNN